jgi:hypothetical protein
LELGAPYGLHALGFCTADGRAGILLGIVKFEQRYEMYDDECVFLDVDV